MTQPQVIGLDIGNSSLIKSVEFKDTTFDNLMNWENLKDLKNRYDNAHFFVCNVGESEQKIRKVLTRVTLLSAQMTLPISLDYHAIEMLGVDRIATAVGAFALFPNQNILIIDCGTCVTYDILNAKGIFEGGVISPGNTLRLESMHRGTQNLPHLNAQTALPSIGKSTEMCMQLGVHLGLEFEIKGFLKFFNKKYPNLHVIFTGGLAKNFDSISKGHTFVSSDLLFRGLYSIWKMNR